MKRGSPLLQSKLNMVSGCPLYSDRRFSWTSLHVCPFDNQRLANTAVLSARIILQQRSIRDVACHRVRLGESQQMVLAGNSLQWMQVFSKVRMTTYFGKLQLVKGSLVVQGGSTASGQG